MGSETPYHPPMLGWFILTIALGYGWARLFAGYPRPEAGIQVLAAREVAFLDAAAQATFPPGGAIPASGREAGIPAYTDRWLQALQPRMRLLIRLLFCLMEQATLFFPAPRPRGFRRFSSLSLEQRATALESWRTSRLYPRRLVFESLRAILTMGFFSHPPVLRQLGLAPLDIETPVCEADLLYPPIGRDPEAIVFTASDLGPRTEAEPLGSGTPLHPRYAGDGR